MKPWHELQILYLGLG